MSKLYVITRSVYVIGAIAFAQQTPNYIIMTFGANEVRLNAERIAKTSLQQASANGLSVADSILEKFAK